MAVRLKDIAHELSLSVSTVCAALQGRPDISQATRDRVGDAVKRLGYQPNSVARSLVTRKSMVLGVIVPDLSRSFFSEVLKGVELVTSQAGYNLLVCNTAENAVKEDQMLHMLRSRQVDGVLLASAHDAGADGWRGWLSDLKSAGIPCVFVDRRFPGMHFVGGDDEGIGRLGTRHLAEQGYRRIAHIAGPQTISTAVGRKKGYLKTLEDLGIAPAPELVIESNYHEESGGYDAMRKLLELPVPPDAVFAASDPIAIGAMEAALEAGLRMPEQLGLIGVGNHQYSRYLRVPLTTMDQQRLRIGEDAARLLLKLISHPRPARPTQILVEPKLMVRASSRRVSDAVMAPLTTSV
jgi:LacI family transcriptional regulator